MAPNARPPDETAAAGKPRRTKSAAGAPAEPPAPPREEHAGAPADGQQSMAAILAEVVRRTRRIADQVSKLEREEPPIPSPAVVAKTFAELGTRLMADPAKFVQQQLELCQQYATLWESAQRRLAGEAVEAMVAPARDDRRFKDPAWSEEPVFDILKQAYLLTAKWVDGTIRGVDGLDPAMRRKALFYSRQMIDAMAPTNFAMTNPEVLRATFASQGENLVRGLGNYMDDLERGKGHLDIRTTDDKPFVLGETIVTTPGKVVHQSELMQLIQYDPQTPQVHRTPLVIVPPWINKYYILDLRPKNSLIRWLVQQGFTVFVVSWANPGAALAHKDFGDYMEEGPLAALAAAKAATGAERVHMTGYCIGGTLQGCALATLARNHPADRSVASATFFTALLDFTDPGDLAVFIDEDQLAELDQNMAAKGYLDGRAMSKVFSMLRDNDLIWSFVVNNYLLGKDPLPFDLLYWNADSTRMPAMMHSFYLRSMYLENKLRVPDAVTLKGTPIDLGRIDVPAYFLSTKEDHIAPWASTYAGARLLKGPVRFVLAQSGHIAGVVNPPGSKYGHWAPAAGSLPESPEAWLKAATQLEGTWWTDWAAWLKAFDDGAMVPARWPGGGDLPVIEDAPGSYVRVRADDD